MLVNVILVVIILILLTTIIKMSREADGEMVVMRGDEDKILYSLELSRDAGTLGGKKRVVFRVVPKRTSYSQEEQGL